MEMELGAREAEGLHDTAASFVGPQVKAETAGAMAVEGTIANPGSLCMKIM